MLADIEPGGAQNAAGFTGRFTAGLRYVESTCVPSPLIVSDPLAGVLAGDRGLALARKELDQLSQAQGPGLHLRVPARSRLIDDLLTREIALLRSGTSSAASAMSEVAPAPAASPPSPAGGLVCQVVSLGAGMCTRPWRLPALAGCAVLEVDLPHIAAAKQELLHAAGAQTAPPPAADTSDEAAAAAAAAAYPLLAASYACAGVDLSTCDGAAGIAAALAAHGFIRDGDRSGRLPTVWVLEALLYYLPLAAASELLCALAKLSAPGSRLIATCVDRELLEASMQRVPKGHVFADLWHFDTEALLYGTEAFTAHWQVDWSQQPPEEQQQQQQQQLTGAGGEQQRFPEEDAGKRQPAGRRLPASTRRLAREWLGAETYVALYGGSELLFTAGLRSDGGGCGP